MCIVWKDCPEQTLAVNSRFQSWLLLLKKKNVWSNLNKNVFCNIGQINLVLLLLDKLRAITMMGYFSSTACALVVITVYEMSPTQHFAQKPIPKALERGGIKKHIQQTLIGVREGISSTCYGMWIFWIFRWILIVIINKPWSEWGRVSQPHSHCSTLSRSSWCWIVGEFWSG